MKRILITGATGNIGREVIHYLCELDKESEIIAAIRATENTKDIFPNFAKLTYKAFDFEDSSSFKAAMEGIDILFLLRPPQISEAKKVFAPLLQAAKEYGIRKIVFLSVQGVEKSTIIPHNKIEKLIKSYGFQYIFVRPSYFMQNLTTSLLAEIKKNKTITLPSGQAKFCWIDAKNIGEAAAVLMNSFDKYQNNAYDITGTEIKSFKEVTDLMSEVIGTHYSFKNINPISFYFKKKNEGISSGFAVVMTILHFLPRFQSEPALSNNYFKLTGKQPTTLKEFITREKGKL